MASTFPENSVNSEVRKRLEYLGRGVDVTKEPQHWWDTLDADTSTLIYSDRSRFTFKESDRGGQATFTTTGESSVKTIQLQCDLGARVSLGIPAITEMKFGVSAGLRKTDLQSVAACQVTAETRHYVLKFDPEYDNETHRYHQYEIDLCKYIAKELQLQQPEPPSIDTYSVSTDAGYVKVGKACFSFIKERQQTHFVSQITLGASFVGIKKHNSKETALTGGLQSDLKAMAVMKLGVSVTWRAVNDFEDSCRRGTFTTGSSGEIEGYTVKRDTPDEAVFKVHIKPLDILIKSPNLRKLLKAQLERYCTPCKCIVN